MRTILADSWQNEALYLKLFQNQKAVTDVQIMPFSAWLLSQSEQEGEAFELLSTARRCAPLKPKLPLLKGMLEIPAFLDELLSFFKSLQRENIPIASLPERNAQEKEMKLLLQALDGMVTEAALQYQASISPLNGDNIEITEASLNTFESDQAAQRLIRNGMKLSRLPLKKPQTVRFFQALNLRQELEACAQWIITHQLAPKDVLLVLCNKEEALVYLKSVFDRSHLPYGIVEESVPSKAAESFTALVLWLRRLDRGSLERLLESALFENQKTDSLLEYLRLFGDQFDLEQPLCHVERALDTLTTLADYEKKQLLKIEQESEALRLILVEYKNTFGRSVLEQAYEILRGSTLALDPQEKPCLLKLEALLNSTQSASLNQTEQDCVLYQAAKIQRSAHPSIQNKICISDLNHPITERKYAFILGADSKSYPGSFTLSGLFEEEYARAIEGYPSKIERASFYNHQRSWIFGCADELILSYPNSTFDGKGLECAYEIKAFVQKEAVSWPLIQNDTLDQPSHQLESATAQMLFLKNGQLQGSVSSFERFWRCPYSYFLHTALKLRKLTKIELSQAAVGTLQHACIEECIRRYGQNYANTSKEELSALVQEQFASLKQFFINQRWQIECIEERCISSLWLQFEFLRDMEENCDLVEHYCEMEFHHLLFAEEDVPIKLNGFIDRIDANLNLLRVLDYKSSYKRLSSAKMEAGLQLQLMTYLLIASELLNKEAAGAYYYSLKNPDIPIEAAKLNLRSGELNELNHEDWHSLWFKERRLSGKTTSADMASDRSGTHLVGWNEKGPTSRQLSNFEEIKSTLLELYRLIRRRLLEGNISCTPVEEACLFCDFGSICRFSGQRYQKNVTSQEIEKERESHAEMERSTVSGN